MTTLIYHGNAVQPALSATDAEANAVALQLAFDVGKETSKPVTVEPGTWPLADTISLVDAASFMFSCAGYTRFNWRGAGSRPMFLLQDVRESYFGGFRISCDPSFPLWAGIQCHNGEGGTYSPAKNTFPRIIMSGTRGGALHKGFLFDAGGGGNNNNDYHLFDGCYVYHFAEAAYSFEASQSKAHRFNQCGFSGYGVGKYGVATGLGESSRGGSFSWVGGGGGGCGVADFYLGTPNDTVKIEGANLENSAKFLFKSGPTSAPFPVTVENVRWAHEGALAADGYAIDFSCAGPLSIRNCRIDGPDAPLAIRMNANYAHAALSVEDTVITSTLASPIIYGNAGRVWLKNNTLHNSSNTALPNIHISGGETARM